MNTIDFSAEKLILTNKFKFRAECLNDIIEFQNNLMDSKMIIRPMRWNLNYINHFLFPDVECDLEINLGIDEVREIMKLQLDSHVMIQTINDLENYTSERDFTIVC